MGALLAQLSTYVTPRAEAISRSAAAGEDFWYLPSGWVDSLTMAGMDVTPELALTLSHVYCAVDSISGDFGTATCQMFEDLDTRGRRRVKFSDPGIGALAYRLRWQPNRWQTAKAFWSTLAWQYLLRPAAYAEIIYRAGSDSIIDQIVPRHPDRVEQLRLANGNLVFRLREPDGKKRYVTEAEMFVVRNTSTDGLNALSRVQYGSSALATGLKLQQFTRAYFQKGATAALLATYKGEAMEEKEEIKLHGSIMRYISGAENAGGVLLVQEDIDVKNLGVDPEKAQLMSLKNLSGRDVARLYKMPSSWLAIEGTGTYSSQVQDATNYVNRCQLPLAVEFEQGVFIHLILGTQYFVKFNLDYLLRGSLKERMDAYEVGIRSRVLRPSEAREREDLNPDKELDELSAMDHRPGQGSGTQQQRTAPARDDEDEDEDANARARARARVRPMLFVHDAARRVLGRERAALTKLAQKHASADQVDAWRAGLQDFYADHAQFIAETLRLPVDVARAVAAQHGALIQDRGIVAMDDQWERLEAEELTVLALTPDPSTYLFEGAHS